MFESVRKLLPPFNRRGRRKTLIVGATLLLTVAGVAIGAKTVLSWTLERLLIADAQFTATDLASVLNQVPAGIAGNNITSARVFAVTVVDQSGRATLTATNGQQIDPPLLVPGKDFSATASLFGDGSGGHIFADVSVPSGQGGGLSVRLDQTGKRAFYWDQLKEAALVFGCIAVIAFGFPATAYYSQ